MSVSKIDNIIVDTSICNIDNNKICGVVNTKVAKVAKDTKETKVAKVAKVAKDSENTNTSDVNITVKSCKNITSKQALLIIPITKFFTNRATLNKLIVILKGESLSLRLIDWFVTNYCKKFNIMYNLTNYKPVNTSTITNNNTFDNFIIIHTNYKGQLKAYSKRNFDPFCRRNRIRFYYEENKYFITTVGQLNFFKWAIENYIINYIQENFKLINDDMNLRCDIKQKKQTKLNLLTIAGGDAGDGVGAISSGAISSGGVASGGVASGASGGGGSINTIESIIGSKLRKTSGGAATRKKRNEISQSASKSLSIHNYPTTLIFD